MAYTTVRLKGDPLQKEGKAAAAVTPGWLVKNSTTAGNVEKHATAGGDAAAMFAIENSLEGQEIGDDYATGDRVQYVHARPGDEIYAWLADGENVSIGTKLESNGDGTLRQHDLIESASDGTLDAGGETIYTHGVIAEALEAVDLSSSSSGNATRLAVLII